MRQKVKGPFTEMDVHNWNENLAACERIRQECELAKQAGFPCDESLNACNALREQLTRMKQVYAPHMQ